ncbi:MAG: hypothetical protein K2Z81_23380, partial [Cyanobacteria bacterium]|nr:hypothetical protein [Cyanobacteriota bacterium]
GVLTVSSTYDRLDKSFTIESTNTYQHQVVRFKDGVPCELCLSLKGAQAKQLRYNFSTAGKIVGLEINGRPVAGEESQRFIVGAEETLQMVLSENGFTRKPPHERTETVEERKQSYLETSERIFQPIPDMKTSEQVDKIVHEYFLNFDQNPLRTELLQLLQNRRSFSLKDLPAESAKELKTKLNQTLKDGLFPSIDERSLGGVLSPVPFIQKLLDGKSLTEQETFNLLTCLQRTDADRRGSCIMKLQNLQGEKHLRLELGPLTETLKQLESSRRGSQPDYRDRFDQLKMEFMVKNLSSTSDPRAFQSTARLLAQEALHGNRFADDFKLWCQAHEASASLFGPVSSNQMDAFATMAREGNHHARKALAGILIGAGDQQTIATFKKMSGGTEKFLVPNLPKDPYERKELLSRAANALLDLAEKTLLSNREILSLTAAIGVLGKTDPRQARMLTSRLDATILGESKEQARSHEGYSWHQKRLDGTKPGTFNDIAYNRVLEAVLRGTPGSEHLVDTVLRHAEKSPSFTRAWLDFENLARIGDRVALRVVIAVAAGCVDSSSQVTNSQPGQKSLRRLGQDLLGELSNHPSTRALVAELMLTEMEKAKDGSGVDDL